MKRTLMFLLHVGLKGGQWGTYPSFGFYTLTDEGMQQENSNFTICLILVMTRILSFLEHVGSEWGGAVR